MHVQQASAARIRGPGAPRQAGLDPVHAARRRHVARTSKTSAPEITGRAASDERESPDRKRSEPRDHRGNREESKVSRGQAIERRQVLDDGNAGREQHRVRGALSVLDTVDVERVDSHERRAGFGQTSRGIPRQVRVSFRSTTASPSDGSSRCGREPPCPRDPGRRRSTVHGRARIRRRRAPRAREGPRSFRARGRRDPPLRGSDGRARPRRFPCFRPCRSGRSRTPFRARTARGKLRARETR